MTYYKRNIDKIENRWPKGKAKVNGVRGKTCETPFFKYS